ncbi:MAG: hypothetical protein D6725_11390, partial [Planctomycetota bacterium]
MIDSVRGDIIAQNVGGFVLFEFTDEFFTCKAIVDAMERGLVSPEDVFGEKGLWPLLELPRFSEARQLRGFAKRFRSFGVYAMYLRSCAHLKEELPRTLVDSMFHRAPGDALEAVGFAYGKPVGSATEGTIEIPAEWTELREVVRAAVYFKGEGPIGRPALQEALKRLRPLIDPEKTPGWFLRLYAAEVLA